MTNDNWKDSHESQIQASGYAPPHDSNQRSRLSSASGNYIRYFARREQHRKRACRSLRTEL